MEPRQHLNPVWRKKADFLIMAEWHDENEKEYIQEQLWCKKRGNNLFEICCIPFFAYDIALGDVVATDDKYFFVDVVEASGRSVIRVWFGDTNLDCIKNDVLNKLRILNCTPEWYSENLLAIDVDNTVDVQKLINYLEEQESKKLLLYEIGKLFQP